MFELDLKNCTACGACVNACPVNAIRMNTDKCGFYYPELDEESCIKCDLCQKICPIGKKKILEDNTFIPQVYAAYAKNTEIRKQSSSGGIFSVLAQHVLRQNGVIYGAAYDENLKVVHTGARTEKELLRLRGSKYVQSFIPENLFVKIKKELDSGTMVLFSGTPCQVAGLKLFLSKEYENLFLVDLLCHGVPSPRVFKEHVSAYERKYKKKITDYSFRNKQFSWQYYNTSIKWNDMTETALPYLNDHYMKIFLHQDHPFLRNSCYHCQYAEATRCSDITIGDFWGFEQTGHMKNTDQGISCVICNTSKGDKFYRQTVDKQIWEPRKLFEVARANGNLRQPCNYSAKTRDRFWNDFINLGWEKAEKNLPYSLKQRLAVLINSCCPEIFLFAVRSKQKLKNFIKAVIKR